MTADPGNNLLIKFAKLDFTEVGKLCRILIKLNDYQSYIISPNFITEIKAEIDAQLKNYQKKFEIVEKKTSVQGHFRKELVEK